MHCDKHIVPNIEYLKYTSSRFFENQPTKFARSHFSEKASKGTFRKPERPKIIAKEEKKRRKRKGGKEKEEKKRRKRKGEKEKEEKKRRKRKGEKEKREKEKEEKKRRKRKGEKERARRRKKKGMVAFLVFIVGFYMTSLKFKLKNYRSYLDFTLTKH